MNDYNDLRKFVVVYKIYINPLKFKIVANKRYQK